MLNLSPHHFVYHADIRLDDPNHLVRHIDVHIVGDRDAQIAAAYHFNSEIDELHENNVRITIFGEKDPFPEKVRAALLRAEDKTRANTGLRLNIALNYGSRAEILRAVRRCAEKAVQLGAYPGDEAFENELYSAGQPELDLMIRTSGEERLSNFLLWQAAYAELYFTPIYWPDFTRDEYIQALREYARRGRRFGGLA